MHAASPLDRDDSSRLQVRNAVASVGIDVVSLLSRQPDRPRFCVLQNANAEILELYGVSSLRRRPS